MFHDLSGCLYCMLLVISPRIWSRLSISLCHINSITLIHYHRNRHINNRNSLQELLWVISVSSRVGNVIHRSIPTVETASPPLTATHWYALPNTLYDSQRKSILTHTHACMQKCKRAAQINSRTLRNRQTDIKILRKSKNVAKGLPDRLPDTVTDKQTHTRTSWLLGERHRPLWGCSYRHSSSRYRPAVLSG